MSGAPAFSILDARLNEIAPLRKGMVGNSQKELIRSGSNQQIENFGQVTTNFIHEGDSDVM